MKGCPSTLKKLPKVKKLSFCFYCGLWRGKCLLSGKVIKIDLLFLILNLQAIISKILNPPHSLEYYQWETSTEKHLKISLKKIMRLSIYKDNLTESLSLISLPCVNSNCTKSRCPFAAAKCRDVRPTAHLNEMCLAQRLNNKLATSKWPSMTAIWRGIRPYINKDKFLTTCYTYKMYVFHTSGSRAFFFFN